MYVGKKVDRDAIHCSASPAYEQTRSCPGRVGVETVSPVWDCSALLCSAPLRFAQPPRRGTLTAGQKCGLQADKMAMLIVKTMAMAGMWEGVPTQKLRVKARARF